VVTKGHHACDWLAETYGVQGDHVHAIYESVELAAPIDDRATWRRRLEIGEDEVVASMLAHFHPGKDQETLLRA